MIFAACAAAFAAGAFLSWFFLSPKLRAAHENLRRAQDDLVRERESAEKLRGEFRLAASDALKNTAEQFLSTAIRDLRQVKTEADASIEGKKTAIESSVEDMKKRLEDTQKLLRSFEENRREMHGKLDQSLAQVLSAENAIRLEAGALRKALTSSIGVRGKWGEQVLEEILEQSGLVKGVGFESQVSMEGEAGDSRPDFVLKLPGGKRLAIDSKEVTGEYLLAQETEDPARQKEHYERLVYNIRSNFIKLGRKEYQDRLDKDVPFVVMFIPSEAAIRAAFATDPSLFQEATSRRVVLASPMTIIPLIHLIKHSWQKQTLAENALELGNAVSILGDRLAVFMGHLNGIRGGLKKALEGWNDAAASWQSRVTPQIEKARTLGGKLKEAEEPSPVEVTVRPALSAEGGSAFGEEDPKQAS